MSTITPLAISDSDVAGWTLRSPLSLRLARLWAKHGVRGRGFVPRAIGRSVAGSTRALIRTEFGAVMAVYPGSLDTYCLITAEGGAYDRNVLDACQKLLRPGETAFDIGANVGLVSLELCARFGGTVRVTSFEPQPDLAKHLAVSARLNAFDIKVFTCLVGDHDGQQTLFVPAHSIHASVISRSRRAKCIVRPVARLDDLVSDALIDPPAVIKIDVEGAEMAVLNGARGLLHDHQPSVVFEADENRVRFRNSRRDLFAELRRHAPYRMFAVADTSDFVPIDEIDEPDTLPHGNYAAVAPRHIARMRAT